MGANGDTSQPKDAVSLAPLDPEMALRALLAVKPDDDPADAQEADADEEDRPPM